jgi:hypothetical protein
MLAPLVLSYTLNAIERTQTHQLEAAGTVSGYGTPSEAAYAASLRYGTALPNGEIGVKIYVDEKNGIFVYSFGTPIYSDVDMQTSADFITYDYRQADGHGAVAGLWHQHALGSTWEDLYGHYDVIARTHQSIWTTIARDFYVQYWDGSAVLPAWTSATPAIAPICQNCE